MLEGCFFLLFFLKWWKVVQIVTFMMLLKCGNDGQMDGQTYSFHRKNATDGIDAWQKCKAFVFFLFTPLWCVSGTCAELLSQADELLLLPSLYTLPEWTFIKSGSCLWEQARRWTHTNWQILHHILLSNWCQLFHNRTCCSSNCLQFMATRYSGAQRGKTQGAQDRYHLLIMPGTQQLKLLVGFPRLIVEEASFNWRWVPSQVKSSKIPTTFIKLRPSSKSI